MDRTIKLNDMWYIHDGEKLLSLAGKIFGKSSYLPAKGNSSFTVSRKIICPKQVNDTVTVYFTGEYDSIRVYAGKTLLSPAKNSEGNCVYDITASLRTGKTYISAVVSSGEISGFYLSVKRDADKIKTVGE